MEPINTNAESGSAVAEIKPLNMAAYFALAFVVSWMIIIPTVCAAGWLIERMTR